jgi:hypothetical protein
VYVASPRPDERLPSRAEFAQEVMAALREAGLEGPMDYEDTLGTVFHGTALALDVHDLHEKMRTVTRENRVATLAKLARALVKQERLPERWEDAKDRVLLQLKRRIEIVAEEVRHSPRDRPGPRPLAEVTPHLVGEACYPVEGSTTLSIPGETYAAWGVPHDVVFRAAAANLLRRSGGQWQVTFEAPGVYRSPWRDGFDASRIFLPGVFGAAPLRGQPVVLAPTPSMLLFAGSEDERGLVELAKLGRKYLEAEKRFFVLRAIRMGEVERSWEDWLPPHGHAAYAGLRFLRGVEEKADYDRQGASQQKLGGPKSAPLPALGLVQSSLGDPLTITVWNAGKPAPLPKADAIILRRGDETLGWAEWDVVARALPHDLKALPSYPPRFLATDFPEEWQLGDLDLKPWNGPT